MADRDLTWLQRWMQAAILDPEGAAADVDEVLTASSVLTARQRLRIYWRGYRLRLLESMRSLHPGLVHLLGEEVFDRFAMDYLTAHPPTGYTLFRLDEGFVDHLVATRPEDDPRDRTGWPDLIIDLARLERVLTEVMEGPGTEDAPVLHPGDLPGPATMGRLRLAVAPCLRLVSLSFPMNEYLAALRRGEDPQIPRRRPVRLVVGRRDYQVTMRELAPADHRALAAIAGGAAAGAAFRGRRADQTYALLCRWTAAGFFVQIEPGTLVPPHPAERAMR
jgi:putative DNA-binding protein